MKFVNLFVWTVTLTVLSFQAGSVLGQDVPAAPPLKDAISSSPSDVIAVAPDNGDCCFQQCCERPPVWYVEADALFLHRTRSRDIKLIEDQNQSSPDPPWGQRTALLTTDALDFDYEWGPRLVLGRWLDECRRVEVLYYGLHHWRAEASLDSTAEEGFPPNLRMPFDDNYTSDFDGAKHVDVNYLSELHNVEANYLCDRGCVLTPLIGFRYVNLNERFNFWSTDTHDGIDETGVYRISTDNNLVGGQIGAALNRQFSDRFCWNFAIKAGAFANFAHQHTGMYDHEDHYVITKRNFSDDGTKFAFVGEINLGLVYQLTQCMSVSAGYQVTWLEGVALAPEQLDYTTTASSGRHLNDNGGVFYDGGYVGLVITR